MASELAQLITDRDNLQRAVRAGVMQVSVDGQSTTFANMKDLRSVLNDLIKQIEQCKGIAQRKPRWSSIDLSRGGN